MTWFHCRWDLVKKNSKNSSNASKKIVATPPRKQGIAPTVVVAVVVV
jgi:hypothetical protein